MEFFIYAIGTILSVSFYWYQVKQHNKHLDKLKDEVANLKYKQMITDYALKKISETLYGKPPPPTE